MVDSYLHPKVVSFINYFYDGLMDVNRGIIMLIDQLWIERMENGEIFGSLYIKVHRDRLWIERSYGIENIMNSNLNPKIEGQITAKKLLEEVANGKVET